MTLRFFTFCIGPALLLGAWGSPTTAAAQTFPLRYGIRAGGNISRGFGADVGDAGALFGYHAGAVANVSLLERLSVQAEAIYSLRGGHSSSFGPRQQAKLTYLDVPLLARYTHNGGFVEAGPYAAYLLSHQLKDSVSLASSPYRNVDYGVVVGFGYQDPGGMSVSWRYVAGLGNAYRPVASAGAVEQARVRNGSLQFTLGYWLPAWPWPFGGRGKDKTKDQDKEKTPQDTN